MRDPCTILRPSLLVAVIAVSTLACIPDTTAASAGPDIVREQLQEGWNWYKDLYSGSQGVATIALKNPDGLDPQVTAFFHDLKDSTPAEWFRAYGKLEKLVKFANTLKKEGRLKGTYCIGRDYAIDQAAKIVADLTQDLVL